MLAEYVKALYQIDDTQNKGKIFALLDRYYGINLDISRSKNIENSELVTSKQLNTLWQAKLTADRALIGVSDDNKAIAVQQADAANEAFLAYRHDTDESQHFSKQQQLSIAQIQALMPKRDILLRYFIDEELSFVVVLTKDDFYVKKLSTQQQIRSWVSDITNSLNARSILTKLKESPLNELLPQSILNSGDHKRLVIIADDTLHQLPFSLLNVAKGSGYKALGASVKLVRTYSAYGFYRQRPNDVNNKKDGLSIALFADPDFQQALSIVDNNHTSKAADNFKQWLFEQPRLTHTKSEVIKIESLFAKKAGIDVLLAVDRKATNAFLLSEQARNANILHIATHGYFDEQNPEQVGLLTAGVKGNGASYGFLGLPELLSKPFNNELVVVSACETMQGHYYKGSGNQNITRGLLAKGAKSVIGTLWKVADRPTSVFMTTFYQHLQRVNGDTALALQLAKQDFRRSGAYRHPIFWAGFVLTATSDSLNLSL